MQNKKPVIRAIDVGYGNTKYIASSINGQAVADHFPSIVHRPSDDEDGSFAESPYIYRVTVEEQVYHVGPGLDAVFEGGVRTLHENFIETDGYMALVYGALSQMDVDDYIDLLVVGLPVSLMGSKRKALEERLAGTHSVMGRDIAIKKVVAVAQPLGGFMSFASESTDIAELAVSRNLLIDPGFFTVDFIASTGLREIKGYSGSHPSGVSAYLKGIAKALSEELNEPYTNITNIDQGLRTGRFKLYGHDVDLGLYHKRALQEILPAAEVISNKIGSGSGIDQVILIGGGAALFKDSIQEILPKHNIICPEQSVVANVLGFQKIGESLMAQQSKKVA